MGDRSPLRYFRTLRHLRPWQILGRLAAPIQRRWYSRRLPKPPSPLVAHHAAIESFPAHEPWNTRRDVLQGRFTFLNETIDLGRPVDWQAVSMSLLWRFNLHYFHYLPLLHAKEQITLCREWIAANPVGQGVGWHPYPTALRLVNWCRAGVEAPDVLKSLYDQAAWLYRNLETHVCGNHLLENARALVLAGTYLGEQGEAERWVAKGLSLYQHETDEQILSDGFHFERSPMYHALMLEGYVDVVNVLPKDHPARPALVQVANDMTDALAAAVHPDGEIALLNDATLDIAASPATLFDYAARVTGHHANSPSALPEAGYYVYRDAYEDRGMWCIIDAGPAGPEYLMAHAHADIFSYELSLGGKRFIVDTGVYEYPSGPMRQYVRGTAAHNTLQIDGADQIECWDSFRVARRTAPHDVEWEQTESGVQFAGLFAGYTELLGDGLTHERRITIDAQSRSMSVEDLVTGRGAHRLESRVHLHPDVQVQQTTRGIQLTRDGVMCSVEADDVPIQVEDGWYCPRFGVRECNTVLVLRWEGTLPGRITYCLQY